MKKRNSCHNSKLDHHGFRLSLPSDLGMLALAGLFAGLDPVAPGLGAGSALAAGPIGISAVRSIASPEAASEDAASSAEADFGEDGGEAEELAGCERTGSLHDSCFTPDDRIPSGKIGSKDDRRVLVRLSAKQKKTLSGLLSDKNKSLVAQDAAVFANYRAKVNGKDGYYLVVFPGLKEVGGALAASDKNTPVATGAEFRREQWNAEAKPATKSVEVHAMLAFQFAKGFEPKLLMKQGETTALGTPASAGSPMLSVEAIRPEGQEVDFMPTALGFGFGIAHLVYDFHHRRESHPRAVYTQLPLELGQVASRVARKFNTTSPATALLLEALERSTTYGRGKFYNLFLSNCTNSIFDVLDATLNNAKKDSASLMADGVKTFVSDARQDGLVGLLKNQWDDKLNVWVGKFPELFVTDWKPAPGTHPVDQLFEFLEKSPKREYTREQLDFFSGLPPFTFVQLQMRGHLRPQMKDWMPLE
jgi:hypothetical protein